MLDNAWQKYVDAVAAWDPEMLAEKALKKLDAIADLDLKNLDQEKLDAIADLGAAPWRSETATSQRRPRETRQAGSEIRRVMGRGTESGNSLGQ